MKEEPTKAYVYQPYAPQNDGKYYAVAGLSVFGLNEDECQVKGLTKDIAQEIARVCNEAPEFAAGFIRELRNQQVIK